MLLCVPLIIAAMVRWMPAEIRHEQLDWSGRHNWHALRVRPASLDETGLAAVLTGAGYRKIPFELTEAEEAALAACHELAHELESIAAASPGQAPPAHLRDQLERWTSEQPTLFYPPYLLASWHRLAGEPVEADRWMSEAFARAPSALIVPYVDEQGDALAEFFVGTIELGFERVIDGELDQNVQLSYPALVTDERGRVYLPAFNTVYRAVRLPAPRGYDAQYQLHRWFEVPAQVGTLSPVVVREN